MLSMLSVSAEAGILQVHAVVLSEPRDGDVGRESADAIATLLKGSGAYDIVDPDVLEGRLGEGAGALFARCAGDVACWRGVGRDAGAEQVVLVERIDAHTLGLRIVDVVSEGGFRLAKAQLWDGRGADPGLLDVLFFQPGSLMVSGAPRGTTLRFDGVRDYALDGPLILDSVASGKHTLEMTAPRHAPWFATLMVYPGRRTAIQVNLTPLDRRRPRVLRWTTWAALGVGVGGAAALTAGAFLSGGRAVRTPVKGDQLQE